MTQDRTGIDFTPSPSFSVTEGPGREVTLVFLGDSLVNGVGDPKGQGWVTRVVARSQHPEVRHTAYNLGVRGNTSADVLDRWRTEVPPRWRDGAERRLVVSVGANDVARGVTLARHRLNLANILDDATSTGVAPFVVSPPPSLDGEVNDKLAVLVDAQADVCARRSVPFVDCFRPLLGHDQWRAELSASEIPGHPGQAGYGLLAWLVLHNGWNEWLGIG